MNLEQRLKYCEMANELLVRQTKQFERKSEVRRSNAIESKIIIDLIDSKIDCLKNINNKK